MTPHSMRTEAATALDQRYRALRLPCPPQQRAALRASLERHGQQSPVLASDGVEEGRLVLIDGFKRAELLAELGTPVRVAVATLDAPSSLGLLLAANASRGGLSDIEEAWVLEAMQRDHGLDQPAIAALVGRHKSWVCRRLQLLTALERQVQDDVRLGLISGSAARELARLPRGNQAAAARAAAANSLSSRQVGRLVTVLKRIDPKERRAVLDDPLAHLAQPGPAEPRADPRLSEQGNRVRQELLRLQSATNRLDELCLEPRGITPQDLRLLSDLASSVLARAVNILATAQAVLVPREVARAS